MKHLLAGQTSAYGAAGGPLKCIAMYMVFFMMEANALHQSCSWRAAWCRLASLVCSALRCFSKSGRCWELKAHEREACVPSLHMRGADWLTAAECCREVVERRTYTVTGQKASAEEIDRLIETGESEQIFQKAILEQGRGHVRPSPLHISVLLTELVESKG